MRTIPINQSLKPEHNVGTYDDTRQIVMKWALNDKHHLAPTSEQVNDLSVAFFFSYHKSRFLFIISDIEGGTPF